MIDAHILRRIGQPPVCSKRACSPSYRAHQRRAELQAARAFAMAGPARCLVAQRGTDERLQGRGSDLPCLPEPRRFLVTRAMTPIGFRDALSNAAYRRASHREPIAKSPIDMIASSYRQRHKIENMFGRLKDWRRIQPATTAARTPSSRYLHRGHRYLLAQSISPDPSTTLAVWFRRRRRGVSRSGGIAWVEAVRRGRGWLA